MVCLQAEYFYAFKDMPEKLFNLKIKNFMEALDEYSDQEIDIALKTVLKECKTCPTTANFIEIIERNRELVLPSAEEEWAITYDVLSEMRRRDYNFDSSYCDIDEHRVKQKEAYNRLSDNVKAYFVDYCNFYDVVLENKFEIEKRRFLKQFPIFRKQKGQKQALIKQMEK